MSSHLLAPICEFYLSFGASALVAAELQPKIQTCFQVHFSIVLKPGKTRGPMNFLFIHVHEVTKCFYEQSDF